MLSKPYVKLSVFQGFYTKQIFCKPIVFLRFAREANLMSTQEFAKVCMRRKSIANSKHSTGLHVLQTDCNCKLKYLHKSWVCTLAFSATTTFAIGLPPSTNSRFARVQIWQTHANQAFATSLLVRLHTCIPNFSFACAFPHVHTV